MVGRNRPLTALALAFAARYEIDPQSVIAELEPVGRARNALADVLPAEQVFRGYWILASRAGARENFAFGKLAATSQRIGLKQMVEQRDDGGSPKRPSTRSKLPEPALKTLFPPPDSFRHVSDRNVIASPNIRSEFVSE
jgi:hypothetical protein